MSNPTVRMVASVLAQRMSAASGLKISRTIAETTGLSDEDIVRAHVEACRTLLAASELSAEQHGVDIHDVPTIWDITQEMEARNA